MYSKLAYHITGLSFDLIRARTANPEQRYLNKEELCHRYATVQNPHCSEIQQDRYNRSASICTRHPERSADCQFLARAASHTLVWQLWFGQTQGQSWDRHAAPHGARDIAFSLFCGEPSNQLLLFWALEQNFISARSHCPSKGISLPCSTSRVSPAGRLSQGITAIRFLSCSLGAD